MSGSKLVGALIAAVLLLVVVILLMALPGGENDSDTPVVQTTITETVPVPPGVPTP